MISSFAQHVANLEEELKKITQTKGLRRLTSTLRTNVGVTPMLHADCVASARLLGIESFIEAGAKVVATCRLMSNGFKSVASLPNRSLVVTRLINLRKEMRLQMARVEHLCSINSVGNGWLALALWRKMVLTTDEGVASVLTRVTNSSNSSSSSSSK